MNATDGQNSMVDFVGASFNTDSASAITETTNRFLADLDANLTDAVRYVERSGFPGMFQVAESLIKGWHWQQWDKRTRRVIENEILRDHGLFYNYVKAMWRIARAKICGQPMRLEAKPSPLHDSDDGVRAANALSKFNDHMDYIHKTHLRNIIMSGMCLMYGKGYVRNFWDPSMSSNRALIVDDPRMPPALELSQYPGVEYLGRIQTNGVYADCYEGPFGYINEEIRRPHEVYVNPGVYRLCDADEFYVVTLRNMAFIEKMFPAVADQVKPEYIQDSRQITIGQYYDTRTWNMYLPDSSDGIIFETTAGLVWLKEHWSRNKSTGKWKHIAYVMSKYNPDGVWLNEGEPEWPHHGWVEFCFREDARAFNPIPPVMDLYDPQIEVDRLMTQAAMNAKAARKPILVISGTPKITDKDNFYEVSIPQTPTPATVSWSTVPNLASDFVKLAQANHEIMKDIFGSNDIAQADPQGVRGVQGLDALSDQDQVVSLSQHEFIMAAHIECAEVKAMLARKLEIGNHVVWTYGDVSETILLSSQTLPSVVRFHRVESNILADTKSARIRQATELWGMGLFAQGREEEAKRFMRFVQATGSDFSTLFPEGSRVEHVIKRHINKIMTNQCGIVPQQDGTQEVIDLGTGRPLVTKMQDHLQMLAAMLERQTAEDLDRWPAPQVMVFEALLERHQFYLDQALQAQQAQQAQQQQQFTAKAQADAQGKTQIVQAGAAAKAQASILKVQQELPAETQAKIAVIQAQAQAKAASDIQTMRTEVPIRLQADLVRQQQRDELEIEKAVQLKQLIGPPQVFVQERV